ncbi:hypothetical protein KY337_01165 [Candidatus Woesearchaeota archaeon]|nr:hypothetical protein [Candidatus Woesearchaeota archaeon]
MREYFVTSYFRSDEKKIEPKFGLYDRGLLRRLNTDDYKSIWRKDDEPKRQD